MLTVGSLFTGIGGFDLGLERAGMRVLWQCESDEFCRRVLAEQWSSVPCFHDVRRLHDSRRRFGRCNDCAGPVDVLCGGFPCQDISGAGRREGIDGARSGLWSEYARLIGELRPRYVIVENVADLLIRGFGRVLGDLAAFGYDAEWDCLPASAFGAHHERDRAWIVAYPSRDAEARAEPPAGTVGERAWEGGKSAHVADSDGEPPVGAPITWAKRCPWLVEPDVGRVADGVPDRVDRLSALGNALVPQIAEWIGRRIIEWELAA